MKKRRLLTLHYGYGE